MKLRLLLVDDHTLFLQGLRALLQPLPEFEVVGDAANTDSAVALASSINPDIILLDFHLPGAKGLDAARRLLALAPQPRILILTGSPDMDFAAEAAKLGVLGLMRKDASPEELHTALRALAEGKTYLCSEAAAAIFRSIRNPHAEPGTEGLDPCLSQREQQVLALVAKGFRNKEIADKIGTSIKSVETYRSRVMTKLGLGSSADLIRYALQHGL